MVEERGKKKKMIKETKENKRNCCFVCLVPCILLFIVVE